jgi:hypothetical protein
MAKATRLHSTPPTSTSAIHDPQSPTNPHSRRSVLGAIAAATAAGATALTLAPARATTPEADPIYAAIERHKAANAGHLAALEELNRLEKTGLRDWGITEKPCHDENDAFDCLVKAAATTVPGIFAKLDYLREVAEDAAWMLDEREGTALNLIESFAASIKTIMVQP